MQKAYFQDAGGGPERIWIWIRIWLGWNIWADVNRVVASFWARTKRDLARRVATSSWSKFQILIYFCVLQRNELICLTYVNISINRTYLYDMCGIFMAPLALNGSILVCLYAWMQIIFPAVGVKLEIFTRVHYRLTKCLCVCFFFACRIAKFNQFT